MRFPTAPAPKPEHCSLCGSTDGYDLHGPDADQGYTGCCNEPVCTGNYDYCTNH